MSSRFHPFGAAHLVVLVATGAAAAGLSTWTSRRKAERSGPVAKGLAGLLVVCLVSSQVGEGLATRSIREALPLHLCDATLFVGAYALTRRTRWATDLFYFWAYAATAPTLFTPDLKAPFPRWEFFAFFVPHAAVVVAASTMTFGIGLLPHRRAWLSALGLTHAYAAVVACLNLALDTNFLYLRRTPPTPTILDVFGPWPWYLFVADLVALVAFVILNRIADLLTRCATVSYLLPDGRDPPRSR